jgi:hypothetical protein
MHTYMHTYLSNAMKVGPAAAIAIIRVDLLRRLLIGKEGRQAGR